MRPVIKADKSSCSRKVNLDMTCWFLLSLFLLKPDPTISNACRGGRMTKRSCTLFLINGSLEPVGGRSEPTGFDWVSFDDATQQWNPLDLQSTPSSLQTVAPVYQCNGIGPYHYKKGSGTFLAERAKNVTFFKMHFNESHTILFNSKYN